MNSIQWGEIAGFFTIIVILFGIYYSMMKRWFLDLETYKADKLLAKEESEKNLKSLEETENKLMDEFKAMLANMQKEKADSEDLKKAEQRIEKIDTQISNLMATLEKQSYRMDLLIDSRTDVSDLVKELKRDMSNQLKDIKDDIARQENKVVTMQLDIQDLKTRLGG